MSKRILVSSLGAISVTPVVIYTSENYFRIGYAWLKYGLAARPFIFVGVDGIVDFIVYGFLVTLSLTVYWLVARDRFIGICALISGVGIILYWLGFVTVAIGVL